jgi:hypothetical protein
MALFRFLSYAEEALLNFDGVFPQPGLVHHAFFRRIAEFYTGSGHGPCPHGWRLEWYATYIDATYDRDILSKAVKEHSDTGFHDAYQTAVELVLRYPSLSVVDDDKLVLSDLPFFLGLIHRELRGRRPDHSRDGHNELPRDPNNNLEKYYANPERLVAVGQPQWERGRLSQRTVVHPGCVVSDDRCAGCLRIEGLFRNHTRPAAQAALPPVVWHREGYGYRRPDNRVGGHRTDMQPVTDRELSGFDLLELEEQINHGLIPKYGGLVDDDSDEALRVTMESYDGAPSVEGHHDPEVRGLRDDGSYTFPVVTRLIAPGRRRCSCGSRHKYMKG